MESDRRVVAVGMADSFFAEYTPDIQSSVPSVPPANAVPHGSLITMAFP
jgi:hypothetical protein